MPKIEYVPKKLKPSSLSRIAQANSIIEEYKADGYELTLRQLYYQFVARDLIANTMREYKNLGSIVNDGRLAGLIDWNAIVDRTRELKGLNHHDSPADIVRTCVHAYHIDKWKDQSTRVEVWIEKDALIGVIERPCTRLDVDYFSCRGYTSQSELWTAAQRLIEYNDAGQKVVIIHLGDHDPSGKDMTRDIEDRFRMFGVEDIEVNRIALNMDQVRKYKPPPNPAKLTDSRAQGYIAEFGRSSWELDALEPKLLSELVRKSIASHMDEDLFEDAKALQAKHRERIAEAADTLETEEA